MSATEWLLWGSTVCAPFLAFVAFVVIDVPDLLDRAAHWMRQPWRKS